MSRIGKPRWSRWSRKIRVLLVADARNIAREPPLWISVLMPWVLALGLRFVMPMVSLVAAPWVDLELYRVHIAAFLLLIPSMMIGWVVGFLLLDERDERVFAAIEVTPLGRGGFLRYRMAALMIVVALTSAGVHICAGLVQISLGATLVAALLASLSAPLLALGLVAFAANKVEGLAIAKLGSVLVMLPILGSLVGGRFASVGLALPGGWALRVLELELEGAGAESAGSVVVQLGIGLVLATLYGALLLSRAGRRVER